MRRVLLLLPVLLLTACGISDAEFEAMLPTLAPTPTPLPERIDYWNPVTGLLDMSNLQDEWGFFAAAGDSIFLQAEGPSLRLTLLDDTGALLTQGDDLIQTTLTEAGEYTARVEMVAGESSGYELTLGYTDRPDPNAPTSTPLPVVVAIPTPTLPAFDDLGAFQTTISSANPAFGAFNDPAERHVYTFQGAAGSYVLLRMERTSGNVDPVLTLYAPGSGAIAIDDNSGGGRAALLNGVRLPQDGVYGVVAYGDGFTGTYEITMETGAQPFPVTPVVEGSDTASQPTAIPIVLTPTIAPAVPGNRLEDHVVIEGSIDRQGGVQRFPIPAAQGEVFTIGLTPGEGFIPKLEIYGPSGVVVAEAAQIGPDGDLVIAEFEAPNTGAFVVFITGQNNTTGPYTLSYGRGDTRAYVRKGETFPDRTYDSLIERRAIADVWFLRLNQGDFITAAATSNDGRFDPILEFVAPDGTVLISDDNGGGGLNANIRSVRAEVSGVYALRVRNADPQVFGMYSLIWRYIEAAPTPTPPFRVYDLFTVDDVLPAYEYMYYPFQGNAGERVLIEVTAAPGIGFDARVALLNANGEVFAEDDDSGGNLNPRLVTLLPEDGTYQIRVSGYNESSGPFVLRVRVLE